MRTFLRQTDDRFRAAFGRARAGWVPGVLLAVLLVGCAKTSEVERVDETNRVQDQRLKAIESDVGAVLNEQKALMEELRKELAALQGRMKLVDERSARLANEQVAITEGLERTLSEQRKLTRTVETEVAKLSRAKLESDSEVDKIRGQVNAVEQLLKSPIARLPAKTEADVALREAYFHLINGEFDIAADRFEQFRKKYPDDERWPEALYRRGQAYFLMRRYDHALIPFFELIDKAPKHDMAIPARWMVARALEETGDLKLAREFYAQLINEKTAYANDATRRVAFINQLYPRSQSAQGGKGQ